MEIFLRIYIRDKDVIYHRRSLITKCYFGKWMKLSRVYLSMLFLLELPNTVRLKSIFL